MFQKLIYLVSLIIVFGFSGSIANGQENQIINGEFDDGLDPWGIYAYQNTADGFTVEVVDDAGLSGMNAAMFDIYDSPALASIGIAQGDLVIEQGKTYPIGFTAKADQVRGLVILLQANINDASWPTYLTETVELTTTRQDYVIEYTHSGATVGAAEGENLIIYFMIKGPWWHPPGENINGKVWFDNVFFGAPSPRQPVYRASGPIPTDGAFIEGAWVSLGWTAGDFAASHDVYMGDNFEDVNNGTGDTFWGNQADVFYVAGFPGYAFPDGLVPGTTYYWRVDEVNEAHPGSPWKGPVWSFTIPPKKAYDPEPANGVKFIDPDVDLDWTAGYEAKMHHVYFGENLADVETGAADTDKGASVNKGYDPGTLEREKTYYWRVDEFDGTTTHTGEVWSFTVAKEGGGFKAEYFNNPNLGGEPVLTRIDPQINFNWSNLTTRGVNSPAENINVDDFSARWSGELEADLTEAYIFRINANNGFRLWLDGRLIIDFWDNPTTDSLESEPIELIRGNIYSIRMEYYEGAGSAVAQLYWSSVTRKEQIIPQAALSLPVKASRPNPSNGAEGAKMPVVFTWYPGDFAASHEIYFGTDKDAVAIATAASPEYMGTRTLGAESFDPGELAWDTIYYWRIDEVNNLNPDSPWKGSVWSFDTGDFFVIDDFEDYDAAENQIWYSWLDGLGYGTPDNPPYFAGNGTGSAVGNDNVWLPLEGTIIHGGLYSLPFSYDNNKQGYANYSEIEKTLSYPRDWTAESVAELSLWFYGDPANSVEPMYVAIANSTGQPVVVVHDNPIVASIEMWTEWVIPLQRFADQGVDLTDVDKIMIGLGTKGNMTTPGGSGTVLFDDIRLRRSQGAP